MTLLLLAGFLAGCTSGGGIKYEGVQPSAYFPLEGVVRDYTYYIDDPSIPYKLDVRKASEELVDSVTRATFEYYHVGTEDEEELVGSLQWSSHTGDSVLIHGYANGADALTPFDPPIAMTNSDDRVLVGDEVVTETGGYTFTATFVETTPECPVKMGLDWTDCLHFSLDDGDGDDNAGLFFVGDYWQAIDQGSAWMQLTGYSEKWDLLYSEWQLEAEE